MESPAPAFHATSAAGPFWKASAGSAVPIVGSRLKGLNRLATLGAVTDRSRPVMQVTAASGETDEAEKAVDGFEEFNITLIKSDGQKLGLQFDGKDGKRMVIKKIGDGLVSTWNDQNPSQKVVLEDSIVEVNGQRGDVSKLKQAIMESSELRCVIARAAKEAEVEVVKDAVDEAAEARIRAERLNAQIGRVFSSQPEHNLVVIDPLRAGGDPFAGSLVRIGDSNLTAVIVAKREMQAESLWFASLLDEGTVKENDRVYFLDKFLQLDWAKGSAWGGVRTYLGSATDTASDSTASKAVNVFQQPVPATDRSVINKNLPCGVIAMDALTPMGRGQSMVVFSPSTLPEDAGGSDLAMRVMLAQKELETGVRTIMVLSGTAEKRERTIARLRENGMLESTMVLNAENEMQALIAGHTAVSIAGHERGDTLVVIDDMQPYNWLWVLSRETFKEARPNLEVPVGSQEGPDMRKFYAQFTERTCCVPDHTLSMVLVQPSASMAAADGSGKASYTLKDFQEAGYNERTIERVTALEERGLEITKEVLQKLEIPEPASGHPTGKDVQGWFNHQHLQEITSLVDGHIELSEKLADAGRRPALDPGNSLTRIGIGSSQMLQASGSTPAMKSAAPRLRLDVASALDYVSCEPEQKQQNDAVLAVLQQPSLRPVPLSEQVLLLFAATERLLYNAAGEKSPEEMAKLLADVVAHVKEKAPKVLETIDRTSVLLDRDKEELLSVLTDYLGKPPDSYKPLDSNE